MRPNRLPALTIGLLVAGTCPLGPAARAADDSKPIAKDDRMAAIVAAVRAEEAKYRHLEYVVKITSRKPDQKAPDKATEVTSLETRQVVLQADRLHFRKEIFDRFLATKGHREEISAFDGEQTRTIVGGNCVNIHMGRFEHPEIYPSHSLALAHYLVNFPLSVYLSGSEAIHAHPKYPRFSNPGGGGSIYEFRKVVSRFEAEEKVGGLNCVKIRVDRWTSLRNEPTLQYLWLATDRNYFCIKEQESWPKSRFGDMTLHEMHVDELSNVAPGLWFPKKITVVESDLEAAAQHKPVVGSRTETIVDKVDLAPRHDAAFFRDVKIPDGLPVFTIKDRALVGSMLPEPIGGEQEKSKLAAVVNLVADDEKRYDDIEVTAVASYDFLNTTYRAAGLYGHAAREERSVLRGTLAYFGSREMFATADGGQSEQVAVEACDGDWIRRLQEWKGDGQAAQISASLTKAGKQKAEGRHDGVPVYRPHTLMMRDDRIYGPLADLLVSRWYDRRNHSRLRFRYCGEGDVDGHPCIKLRGDVLIGERSQPSFSIVLFLATDRNLIPIRIEDYGSNHGYNAKPQAISRCDDFREIAPGTWYPRRVTELSLDHGIPTAQGRIILNWRRDYRIKTVTWSPQVADELFRDVVVPPGTAIEVRDQDSNYLGNINQPEEGVAEVTSARYAELQRQAKVPKENKPK